MKYNGIAGEATCPFCKNTITINVEPSFCPECGKKLEKGIFDGFLDKKPVTAADKIAQRRAATANKPTINK